MPLTNEATHQKWIKATEEWTQEFRKGPWSLPNVMHFDRNFSIDDMTWRRLGNLMFNVKLKTNFSVDPIVIIETGSKEILNDLKSIFFWQIIKKVIRRYENLIESQTVNRLYAEASDTFLKIKIYHLDTIYFGFDILEY